MVLYIDNDRILIFTRFALSDKLALNNIGFETLMGNLLDQDQDIPFQVKV